MRRRLYFVVPDVLSARRIRDELLLARIEDAHLHVIARDGMALGDLHEASILQKTDFVHGAEIGLAVGGGVGIIAGLLVILFPPEGINMQMVTVLVTALLGAVFGVWVSSMKASSVPNSRLKAFEGDIEAGHILMMVDVPSGRVDEIRTLVASHHPEVMDSRMEPAIPAFP
ncbi:MAG: DUF1269 domain-containing protein [Thiobacillaceae bacterium]